MDDGIVEDRIRDRELNRHLDSRFAPDRLPGIISDLADEAITNGDKIMEIFDNDPVDFCDRVAGLFFQGRQREKGITNQDMRESAYFEFEQWLTEQARELNSIKVDAQCKLDQESFYSDDDKEAA